MNNEVLLISAAVKDRGAFERIAPHLEKGDLSERGERLWDIVREYYDRDGSAAVCALDVLRERFLAGLQSDKHKQVFSEFVDTIGAANASVPNVVDYYLSIKRTRVGSELASALLRGGSGGDVRGLLELYSDLQSVDTLDDVGEEAEILRAPGIRSLLGESFSTDRLIQVWPDALNRRLDGGLKPGHHVVLFARPEMGKTLAVINMMAGFLEQDLRVLYVGNEDPVPDIVMRMVNRLTGMNKYDVLADLDLADDLARRAGYNNLVLAGLAPGTPREITKLVEEYEPQVLVIDQLRNLNTGNDSFVQKLEEAATFARNLAKKYQMVVVSVTQAGDSAQGKPVLDLGDVDFSNTGIPAACDVMIGIGASERHMAADQVVLSMPKNKVSGKHEWFTCQQNRALSSMEGID